MCLHPRSPTVSRPAPVAPRWPAQALTSDQRQHRAVEALAHTRSRTDLAGEAHVSRTFVYQQVAQAEQALHDAFAPDPPAGGETVLFHLPVTERWLQQLVKSLVLTCHSSLRGVPTLLEDVFDQPLALGTVHRSVTAAAPTARAHNAAQELTGVRSGAHDAIYQAGRPVLVGVDADATSCYLLSAEDGGDADTWGVRLLALTERGLAPEATLAAAARGQRAGHALALPGVSCRGAHCHLVQYFAPVQRTLEDRAQLAWATIEHLQRQQARGARRRGRQSLTLSHRLPHARRAAAQAVALADDVAILWRWLREDILAVAGPDGATRRELYDFVVAALQAREAQGPERLKTLRQRLAHQRDGVLALAHALDERLQTLAASWAVPAAVPRALALLQFSLNHRRFLRRERPERVGHSPGALLTGQAHAHRLELLGSTRFRRS